MNRRQITGMIIACAILAFCFTPWFEHWVAFPEQVRLMAGTPYLLRMPLPFGLSITVDQPGLMINDQLIEPHQWLAERGSCALYANQPGSMQMQLKLFGLLPLRRLTVEVLPPVEVVPAGQSIGVTIQATTMVVGYASVQAAAGNVQPAKNAGLQLGDLILAVNDRQNPSAAVVAEEVIRCGKSGSAVGFLIQREQQQLRINVQPALCRQSQRHRIGLYVRDDAAGVGTLTFVDRESRTFAALGHIIADIDTNQALQVKDGRIMRSSVTSIDQGRSGHPGEKRSVMVDQGNVIGTFTANTGIGIFGELQQDITTGMGAMPVALVDQVQPGKAEIWTVIEGEQVKKFDIEIVRVNQQFSPGTKGMVIKVTDPELLEKTGGIVQGMSGSPIIQRGKLVGAVTHVFVNKPDTGYGVFAEWMVRESGLVEKREQLAPTFFYRKYLSHAGL